VNWHEYVGESTGRSDPTGNGDVVIKETSSGGNKKKVWREEGG
jgi:hypothetical protein